MLIPLGRVAPTPVRRFADKLAQEVKRQTIDVTDWLAEVTGETISVVTLGVVPSLALTVGAASWTAAGVISWQASAGTENTDYQIVITYTANSGRKGQEVWRCLVPVALGGVTTPVISGAGLSTLNMALLPTAPDGLPSGTIWNNGGLLAVVA